ncbi:MAG TPA: twin-arginine translocation signal domain-containing protein, partial [Clostridia bacterium]|nr:twin-arginine translocation signal domain-containing protein [Clostridia bacterium]
MATVSRRDFLKGIAAGTAGVTFMANTADAS